VTDLINKRDTTCELKLLKLITEDKKHNEELLIVPKTINKLNRYSDVLPYKYNACMINKDLDEEKLKEYYFNGSFIQVY